MQTERRPSGTINGAVHTGSRQVIMQLQPTIVDFHLRAFGIRVKRIAIRIDQTTG